MAEQLALPTSDHGVAGSNPAGGEILPEPKQHFIAQSLSCSPFHHLEMTEILLKGHKTLAHPSIHDQKFTSRLCEKIGYRKKVACIAVFLDGLQPRFCWLMSKFIKQQVLSCIWHQAE